MMAKSYQSSGDGAKKDYSNNGNGLNRAKDALNTSFKMWQTAFSTMNEPGTLYSILEGFNTLPGIFTKMTRNGLKRSFQLQSQWIEKEGKIGRGTDAYSYENLKDILR